MSSSKDRGEEGLCLWYTAGDRAAWGLRNQAGDRPTAYGQSSTDAKQFSAHSARALCPAPLCYRISPTPPQQLTLTLLLPTRLTFLPVSFA